MLHIDIDSPRCDSAFEVIQKCIRRILVLARTHTSTFTMNKTIPPNGQKLAKQWIFILIEWAFAADSKYRTLFRRQQSQSAQCSAVGWHENQCLWYDDLNRIKLSFACAYGNLHFYSVSANRHFQSSLYIDQRRKFGAPIQVCIVWIAHRTMPSYNYSHCMCIWYCRQRLRFDMNRI